MDAVIAWVDGSDPAHAEKRRRFAAEAPHAEAGQPTRWSDRGEVLWCVASLLRFAPFLRRIHLVTDAQVPQGLDRFARAGLCEEGRIRVVDHREVFRGFEEALPCFNSIAIESVLWRIPGLDEEFVYLNDDFVLLRPHEPADFFRDGRPVLRGRWASAWPLRLGDGLDGAARRLTGRPPPSRPSFRRTHLAAARLAGSPRRFWTFGHAPHPMRRSLLAAFFARRPEALARQVAHRFRDRSMVSAIALAHHLAIASAEGAVLLPPAGELLLDFSRGRAGGDPAGRLRASRAASACIQSLDLAPPGTAEALAGAIGERLGPALPRPA